MDLMARYYSFIKYCGGQMGNIIVTTVVITLLVSTTAESYFVSETSSTWTEKDKVCSIATPPIQHTPAGITVQINNTNITEEGVWVGYSETFSAFDYIGCFDIINLQSKNFIRTQSSDFGSRPGQCFSSCSGGLFFGIAQSECYCLKEDHTIESLRWNYTHCITECYNQSGIACGGETENGSYISVYKLNDKVPKLTSNSIAETCLELNVTKEYVYFEWQNCSKDLLIMCEFDGVYVQTSSPGKNTSWLENANRCFVHGGTPIFIQGSYHNISGSNVWTNVIRSPVISYGQVKLKSGSDSILRYGFVKRINDDFVLDFSKENTLLKQCLCNYNTDQGARSNLSTVVLIGASSAGFLLVAVVTVVMICVFSKRRRNTPKTRQKREKPATSGGVSKENEYVNHAYDSIVIEDAMVPKPSNAKESSCGQEVHQYYILKKHEREPEDAACGETKSVEQSSAGNGPHVYDRLNSIKTYDHIINKKCNTVNSFENAYNKSEKNRTELNNTDEKRLNDNGKIEEKDPVGKETD